MNELKDYYKKIAKEYEELYERCSNYKSNPSVEVRPNKSGILLYIYKLEDLKEAREVAKSMFPEWKDKLRNIWVSCGSALASWEDLRYSAEIRLRTTVEEFPKALMKEGCRFIEVDPGPEIKLVCGVKNA